MWCWIIGINFNMAFPPLFRRLFKNVQMQGARGPGSAAYILICEHHGPERNAVYEPFSKAHSFF
jgi:hypothetical protein